MDIFFSSKLPTDTSHSFFSSEQESWSELYLYKILKNQKFGMVSLTFLLCITFLQLMKKTATASQNSLQCS